MMRILPGEAARTLAVCALLACAPGDSVPVVEKAAAPADGGLGAAEESAASGSPVLDSRPETPVTIATPPDAVERVEGPPIYVSPLRGANATTMLGVGRIRPDPEQPFTLAEWLADVTLPLYESPDGETAGRIVGGWHEYPGHAPKPMDTAGLLETGYEEVSMIVLERRPDGWLKIRLSVPSVGTPGTAWAREEDLLSAGLTFEGWGEMFLRNERPLFFRNRHGEHELLAAPDTAAARTAEIGPDHDLKPLEVAGEWMRVRVTQPSQICRTAPESVPSVHEGWIRWLCDDLGPCLWYYTRGC